MKISFFSQKKKSSLLIPCYALDISRNVLLEVAVCNEESHLKEKHRIQAFENRDQK